MQKQFSFRIFHLWCSFLLNGWPIDHSCVKTVFSFWCIGSLSKSTENRIHEGKTKQSSDWKRKQKKNQICLGNQSTESFRWPQEEAFVFCFLIDDIIYLLILWSQGLGTYRCVEKETDMLLSTLSAMQEKAQHLEYNLSAETRIKLDLFSALGDARRQLEIAQGSVSVYEIHNLITSSFLLLQNPAVRDFSCIFLCFQKKSVCLF